MPDWFRSLLNCVDTQTFEVCFSWSSTFIEADFVPQNDHAFSEQLVLKVFSEEGAQLGL